MEDVTKGILLMLLIFIGSCQPAEEITPNAAKKLPKGISKQLRAAIPEAQRPYVLTFMAALEEPSQGDVGADLNQIRSLADQMEAAVRASVSVRTVDRQQLEELVGAIRGTANYLEAGGVDEIRAALAKDLVTYGWYVPNDPLIIEATKAGGGSGGCSVDIRDVMIGAVVGFFSGATTGAYTGAVTGTFTAPVVGTVTGAVSGAMIGGAYGFFGGVVSGVAADLLKTCLRRENEIDWVSRLGDGPVPADVLADLLRRGPLLDNYGNYTGIYGNG